MMRKISGLALVVFFILACTPLRERAITELPRGNTCVLGCDLKQAMETTRIVLLEMGFKIVDENKEEKLIDARKATSRGKLTSIIDLEIGFVERGQNETELVATATEKVSKTSTHIKKFWLIFIPIPYGTYHTEAVLKESTVTDPMFYEGIFKKIRQKLGLTSSLYNIFFS